jgi:hypothetical protein
MIVWVSAISLNTESFGKFVRISGMTKMSLCTERVRFELPPTIESAR